MRYAGNWSATQAYLYGDMVFANGESFICVAPQGSLNQAPASFPAVWDPAGGGGATPEGVTMTAVVPTWNAGESDITFQGQPTLAANTAYLFSASMLVSLANPSAAGDRLDVEIYLSSTQQPPLDAPVWVSMVLPTGTTGYYRATLSGVLVTQYAGESLYGVAKLVGNAADYALQIFNPVIISVGNVSAPLQPPAAPANVDITDITTTTATATWDPAARAASYTAVANPGAIAGVVTGTSAIFNGLAPNTSYTATITAVNAAGSAAAAPVPFTTDPTPPLPPAAPTALVASAITDNSFTVSWSAAGGATSYTAVANPGAVAGVVSGLVATFSGLTAATPYTVVVTAVNDAGTTPSAPLVVNTLPAPPPPPVAAPEMLLLGFLTPSVPGGNGWGISSILTPSGTISMTTGVSGGNPALNGGNVVGYLRNAQTAGYKVMVSFGGSSFPALGSIFTSATVAQNIANSMAYALCGKTSVPNPLGWLPLGDPVPFYFDGIDLDLEESGGTQATAANVVIFAQTLRAALNNGTPSLLTCSFQAPEVGSFSPTTTINTGYGTYQPFAAPNTPLNAYVVPSPTQAGVALIANLGLFDYINIQSYNQGVASPTAPYGEWGPGDSPSFFQNNLAQFAYAVNRQGGQGKIYSGLMSDPNTGPGQPGGSGPPLPTIPTPAQLRVPFVAAVNGAQADLTAAVPPGPVAVPDWFAGAMSWDSPYAGNFCRSLLAGTGLPQGYQLYGGQTYAGQGSTSPYPAYGPQNPGWDQTPAL